jgi:hypothetical protein
MNRHLVMGILSVVLFLRSTDRVVGTLEYYDYQRENEVFTTGLDLIVLLY